jgi:tetratricopeptide (TPR) repeat protein
LTELKSILLELPDDPSVIGLHRQQTSNLFSQLMQLGQAMEKLERFNPQDAGMVGQIPAITSQINAAREEIVGVCAVPLKVWRLEKLLIELDSAHKPARERYDKKLEQLGALAEQDRIKFAASYAEGAKKLDELNGRALEAARERSASHGEVLKQVGAEAATSLGQVADSLRAMDQRKEDYDKGFKEARDAFAESTKKEIEAFKVVAEDARSQVLQDIGAEVKEVFEKKEEALRNQAWRAALCAVLAAGLIGWFWAYVLNKSAPESKPEVLYPYLLARAFAFSIMSYLLVVFVRNYLARIHLAELYAHRAHSLAVLPQLTKAAQTLPLDARATVFTAAANAIFTTPETGFISGAGDSGSVAGGITKALASSSKGGGSS